MKLFATVGIVGLAVSIAVGGSEPAPASSTPLLSELVFQLGAEDFRERENAAAALEKAGEAAIPALREAVKSENPEVRQRAAAILFKLQRAVNSSEKLSAKKLTLNYKNAPLGHAITDLRTRSGLNIAIDPSRLGDPLRKVTCVTGELPVWEALDAFCAAAGLKEEFRPELELPKMQNRGRGYLMPQTQVPNADSVPIVLVGGKLSRLPGDRRTAVRVLVLPRSFPSHRVSLGTGEITLCFDITPTPGLNWQDATSVKITKLVDDAGRFGGAGSPKPEIAPSDIDNVMVLGGLRGGVVFAGPGVGGAMRFDPQTGAPIYPDSMPNPRVIPVPLKLATPTARSIKRLEGSVLGEITLTNQTLITVNEPKKHIGTVFEGPGSLQFTIASLVETKQGTDIQLVLEYPSPWSVGARRGWNPGGVWPEAPRPGNQTPTVQVYDAAGKSMSASTASGFTDVLGDGQTMQYRLNWTFRKEAGTPAKFVVVGPRPMIVEVPFVLENVPLP